MKTKHRVASHAKRKFMADPLAMYRLFNKIKPFDADEQMQLNLPVRLAFESLKSGKGEEGDFHTLAAAVNVCMIRSESIDPMAEMTAIAGRDAMVRTWERFQRTSKFGFDGLALQDLPIVIDLHEQLIALSTPKQMADAMQTAIKRMDAGQHLGGAA